MALHSGIDTVAFVTGGAYSENYGASAIANLTNLFCSYGLFEDAPDYTEGDPAEILFGETGRLYMKINKFVIKL